MNNIKSVGNLDEYKLSLLALPTSWGKLDILLQNLERWVASQTKTYRFIIKSITATNPPYEI